MHMRLRHHTTRQRLLPAAAATALALGLLPAVSPPADAAPQATYYASPSGSGSACSQDQPCALSTAKAAVESQTTSMTGDLVVNLMGGTYELPAELTFDSADSGHNGHQVVYQAVTGQEVVLSGGRTVTGWSLHDSNLNIYRAPVPVGLDTRQLYIDGRRASVASQTPSLVFGYLDRTSSGYNWHDQPGASTIPDPGTWSQTDRVDFVYGPGPHFSDGPGGGTQGWAWRYSLCPVDAISATTVTMAEPCWTNAVSDTGDIHDNWWPKVTVPTLIENNLALLTQPGQFYADPDAGYVYYIPRDGEDLDTATTVAPRLEHLLTVDHAHDLRFSGITFAHATWLFGDQGVVDIQANALTTTTIDHFAMMPAAVTCAGCNRVTFSGDTFTHLGASGLALAGAGTDNLVSGNIVTDVSGNGIQIGDIDSTSPAELETGDTVTNNYVYDVSNEYLGGVGIFAGYVAHTSIDHNEVWGTPYTGISLGWGWGGADPGMVDNHVDDNRVHDVQTASLRDGGSIYINGTQGASPASTIRGNYVAQESQAGGSLYLDNGASHWQVTDNVVADYSPGWLNLNPGFHWINPSDASDVIDVPHAHANTIQDNYVESSAGGIEGQTGAGNTPEIHDNIVSGNHAGLTSWPTAAEGIMSSAGLDADHIGLRGPEITNLAYLTPAVASSQSSASTGPAQAVTDQVLASSQPADFYNYASPYKSAGGESFPWWETDLGAPHDLLTIQVLFRQHLDPNNPDIRAERMNFEIWVSPDARMSLHHHTVACRQGSTALAMQARYECPAPPGQWQSVAVVKTDGTQLVMQQVRVFGAVNDPVTPPAPTPSATPPSPTPTSPTLLDTTITAVHQAEPSRYGQGSSVTVIVARDGSSGPAPTGTAQLTDSAGKQLADVQLVDGVATVGLPAMLPVGKHTLTATYAGSDAFSPSHSPVVVTVQKALTATKAKRPKGRLAYQVDFKITVKVKATGFVPQGRLKIKDKGKVIGKGRLRRGKATIRITKNLKVGKHQLVVKYLGSSTSLRSKGHVTINIARTTP